MTITTSDVAVRHGVTSVDVLAIEARLRSGFAKEPLPVLKTQQAVDLLYRTIKDLKASGVSYEAIAAGLREHGMVVSSHSLGTMLRRHEARLRKEEDVAGAGRRQVEAVAVSAEAAERLAARNAVRRANYARRREAAKAAAAAASKGSRRRRAASAS